jgi:phage tail sheath protein FI
MTQNDLDAGRVIVEVQFDPAAPVERITVMLALAEGGRVSLVSES